MNDSNAETITTARKVLYKVAGAVVLIVFILFLVGIIGLIGNLQLIPLSAGLQTIS